jgi:5'-3' exonuclease
MDRKGIGSVRRAELLARLDSLEQQIEAQAARVGHARSMHWKAQESLLLQRLQLLQESRDLYLSALRHLLGDDLPANLRPSE